MGDLAKHARVYDGPVRWAVLVVAACGGGDTSEPPCRSSVLYLNRTGGLYDRSAADNAGMNLSTIVDAPRTLGAYPHDDIEWGFTTQCIRAALLPFPIEIVESDPGLVPHTELVFTTSYWAGPAGVTHVIPDGCRPNHEVGFVFGAAIATDARACQVAMIAFAQMTALLSYGANCRDFVDRSMDCVPDRTFADEEVTCVDANAQPIACRCGGTTQNTYRAIAAAHPVCP
jgi:hypothetical protein